MGFFRFLGYLFALGFLLLLGGGVVAYFVVQRYSQDLPDYTQLANYNPPVVTRVLAGDGRLMAEYAIEKRIFVPIGAIPKQLINAFLAAEDKNFYSHPGIDIVGIAQATLNDIMHIGSDRRPIGASTITQQVAKNFLLGNEVSFRRKIREIILALRIEKAFTKDRILELYLNQIYLGAGNYGVTAAALNYFDKSLDDLTIGECAYLGSLPKAPNNYDLAKHADAALARRNWVIGRMLDDGFISADDARAALAEPLVMHPRSATETVSADYFTEEVRRELVARFGEDALYKGGLTVRTSLDPHLQALADSVLRNGLENYDRQHGYRGPVAHVDASGNWPEALAGVNDPPGLYDWQLALVLSTDAKAAQVGLRDGSTGTIPLAELTWARHVDDKHNLGAAIRKPSDAIVVGDVVMVEKLAKDPARPRLSRGYLRVAPDPGNQRRHAGHGSPYRTGPGGHRGLELPDQRIRSRPPGHAPAGLRLQADRLSDRLGERHDAFHRGHGRAHRHRPGQGPAPVAAGELREELPRAHDLARRPGEIAQPDDDPRRPGDRHEQDRRHGQAPRRGRRAAAGAGHGAGRGGDDRAQAHQRLCPDRQWRQEGDADPDRPGPGQARPHDLPPRRSALRRLFGSGVEQSTAAHDPRHPRAAGGSAVRLSDRVT